MLDSIKHWSTNMLIVRPRPPLTRDILHELRCSPKQLLGFLLLPLRDIETVAENLVKVFVVRVDSRRNVCVR